MNTDKVLKLLDKYSVCPKCGNRIIGKGEGTLIIDNKTFIRTCKCGFRVKEGD